MVVGAFGGGSNLRAVDYLHRRVKYIHRVGGQWRATRWGYFERTRETSVPESTRLPFFGQNVVTMLFADKAALKDFLTDDAEDLHLHREYVRMIRLVERQGFALTLDEMAEQIQECFPEYIPLRAEGEDSVVSAMESPAGPQKAEGVAPPVFRNEGAGTWDFGALFSNEVELYLFLRTVSQEGSMLELPAEETVAAKHYQGPIVSDRPRVARTTPFDVLTAVCAA